MRTDKIAAETLIAFKQGAKLPGKPHKRTLERWAFKGLSGKKNSKGKPITLEYCYIGGRLYTSAEAFQRWTKKINQGQGLRL